MKTINKLIKKYRDHYTGLPKSCWQAITLVFVEAIAGGITFFLSLYFVNSLKIKIDLTGILFSALGLGTILGGTIGGKLSDHINVKSLVILSLLIEAITIFLLTQLNSFTSLIINLLILGFATYVFKTANNIWMLKQLENGELKLKTLNISRAASNLGLSICGIIIGFLGNNFHIIFYCSGIFLLGALLYFVLNTININERKIISSKISSDLIRTHNNNYQIIFLMFGCVFIVGFMIAQLSATYPLYIEHAFPLLGIKAISILFTIDTLMIVFFQTPLINILKNQNRILVVGTGMFLMGMGLFFLNFLFCFFVAIITCIIFTTGEMLFFSMAQLACYDNVSIEKKGIVMGLFQSIYSAGTILGPLIGTFIYQHHSSKLLWYLCGMLGSFCFIGCLFLKIPNASTNLIENQATN